MFFSKNGQIKQTWTLQNASASALAYSPTFDHTAAFPKSPHWKPVKCYIHFKELLLFSKVLNTKLESLSNLLFALCSRHKCEITVSGFIGSPASLRDCSSTAFCCCASLSGSIICFRVQRDQSSCFQKSKLEGIGWEPLLIVSKWQRTLGPCATNGVISTWNCPASDKKALRTPGQHS